MYTSISELPTQVRNSLDDYSCNRWMQKYNEVLPANADDKQVIQARRTAWDFVKSDPSSFSFNIIATVEMIDRQKELITVESVAKNMDDYLIRGGVGIDEHADYEVFCAWGWDPTEVNGKPAIGLWGNLYGGTPVYDKVRKDFVNGKHSLSIAGEADMGKYECTEEGCYIKRSVQDKALMEISLCSVPANPGATLIWYNHDAKLTKSVKAGEMRFDVVKYTIHKDYTECPIQAVKKSLIDAGIEAHAKDNGVEVDGRHAEVISKSRTLGFVRKSDGTLIVQSKQRMYEKAYGNCLKKGYIDSAGHVLNRMPKKVFKSLSEQDMLKSDGKSYILVKSMDNIMSKSLEESGKKWYAYAVNKMTHVAYEVELRNHPSVSSDKPPVFWVASVTGSDGTFAEYPRPSGNISAEGYFADYTEAIKSKVEYTEECSKEDYQVMYKNGEKIREDDKFTHAMQTGNMFICHTLDENSQVTFYRLTDWDGRSATFREFETLGKNGPQKPGEATSYELTVDFSESYSSGKIHLPNGKDIVPFDGESVYVDFEELGS